MSEAKTQSVTGGLFGGNSNPPWFDHLSELKELETWPDAEKSLQEMRFCKDELASLHRSITAEQELIAQNFEHITSKLQLQIQGITQNLFSYFNSHPGEIETRKPYLEQLSVEIEEIHKYKIKFTKRGEKTSAQNKII